MKIGLRIWILIITLFLSLLAIQPWKVFDSGIIIKSVEPNSTAFSQGLRSGQIIKSIDGKVINSVEEYAEIISKKNYANQSIKTTILTDKGEFILFSNKPPEIIVSETPKSNIRAGLDFAGGSRALVKAKDKKLSSSEVRDLVSIVENRLNIYGVSDVRISPVTDLQGDNFMLVEIAGESPQRLRDLIAQQGEFEAKIGNETVFMGGINKDITSVCRADKTCAFIEQCTKTQTGELCRFRFEITLSPAAAQRHADLTKDLSVNITPQGRYLSLPLDLYLDGVLVDSLLISESLKGVTTTQILISGSGSGETRDIALREAENEMKRLQTILITGSLPYKLEIVKLDNISPYLGKTFTENIILLGIIVFIIISIILFIKYRKIKITLSVILTMFSEAFITIGVAALIKWNLDAPSIAGIIAGMGTGVNDQIVILDESTSNLQVGLKERIKKALFIIIGAFFTIVAAMLPLFWAGAGILRGFAFTTIIGVTIGILVTRPAFAEIIRKIQKD
ncbi:MAG: site-2 protease family protein [Candidatus Pacearchaeota archaeon]